MIIFSQYPPPVGLFFVISPSALTPSKLDRQVLRGRFFGFDFNFTSSQMRESNPGRLGEKREHFLCAMPSPVKM